MSYTLPERTESNYKVTSVRITLHIVKYKVDSYQLKCNLCARYQTNTVVSFENSIKYLNKMLQIKYHLCCFCASLFLCCISQLRGDEKCETNIVSQKRRHHSKNLDVDGRIIMAWTLSEPDFICELDLYTSGRIGWQTLVNIVIKFNVRAIHLFKNDR